MMIIARYLIWFIAIVILQVLIFSEITFGLGIHIMIYPMLIIMWPFDIKPIPLMFLAFLLGISLDFLSNTFGLHTSSAVLVAYFRPELFRLFAPRDGYDLMMKPSLNDLGFKWFFYINGITLLIHHFWFFFLEIFSWKAWVNILQNTFLSAIFSLFFVIALEVLFRKKRVDR